MIGAVVRDIFMSKTYSTQEGGTHYTELYKIIYPTEKLILLSIYVGTSIRMDWKTLKKQSTIYKC